MTKQGSINQIKEIFQTKEDCFMKIYIQPNRGDNRKFYKQTYWPANIDVVVKSEENANALVGYLEDLENKASSNPRITGIQIIKDE